MGLLPAREPLALLSSFLFVVGYIALVAVALPVAGRALTALPGMGTAAADAIDVVTVASIGVAVVTVDVINDEWDGA